MATPLGLMLPIQLGSGGYFKTTTDPVVQVRINLINLLLTKKGERPFQPDFGCDLPKLFFESLTDDKLAESFAIIQTAVNMWMPFVQIDDVIPIQSESNNHKVDIKVEYTILTLNVSDSLTLVL
jgi:phage baseplate assembly protein W